MAPKIKITKEMILDGAFELVREAGAEALNARSLADKLQCSTQPILYQFRTMDEIREAVYRRADDFHTQSLLAGVESAADPFLSIGLAYIRFGYEEKNLFRFLFQTNQLGGQSLLSLLEAPEMAPLLAVAQRELACGEDEIKEKFLVFAVAVHGYASLLANNALEYDEKQAEKTLVMIFEGMKKN